MLSLELDGQMVIRDNDQQIQVKPNHIKMNDEIVHLFVSLVLINWYFVCF